MDYVYPFNKKMITTIIIISEHSNAKKIKQIVISISIYIRKRKNISLQHSNANDFSLKIYYISERKY